MWVTCIALGLVCHKINSHMPQLGFHNIGFFSLWGQYMFYTCVSKGEGGRGGDVLPNQ